MEAIERFAYLFTASDAVADAFPGESATLAAVSFLGAVGLADMATGDVASTQVSGLLDRSLEALTPDAMAELLVVMLGEGALRLDRVFHVPERSPGGIAAVRERLLQALDGVRRALGSRERSSAQLVAAGRGMFDVIASYFTSELVELKGSPGGSAPKVEEEGSEGARRELYLMDAERHSVLPLHPFVRQQGAAVVVFRGARDAGIAYGGLGPGEESVLAEPAVLEELAMFLQRIGLYRRAMAVYKALGGEHGHVYDYRQALHASHAFLGSRYYEQGKYALAARELESALRYRSDLPLTHYNLCRAYARLKQNDLAVDQLRQLLSRQPGLDKCREILGDLLYQKGDLEEAARCYSEAAERNPSNRWADGKRLRVADELKASRARAAAAAKTAATPASAPEAAKGEKAERRLVDDMLTDLTTRAERGAFAPLVGRERELAQMVEILACRQKRHVLLVGDAGVGKSALVEELANRIVAGRVPAHLRGKRLYLMNVATLLAGAKFRGQFEERVLELVKELASQSCLLFIDDFHTIVNSGLTKGGSLDTSSLLKPALVRGEIQSVGATTHDELRTNIEKDPSLLRCYQIVKVEEPPLSETRSILGSFARRLEEHHNVRFAPDALGDTLEIIRMCLRDRALPDKAIDVLDRAAAKAMLRGSDGEPEPVRRDDVLAAISDLSGVPAEKLAGRRTAQLSNLEEALGARVVGQREAVARVARVVRAAKLNLDLRANRPDGVFLFVGPTGVGKTELARALSEYLFGDEEKLIRIDMSEYMERISSSRLIGAAPGYVGYNDQNQLTDLVRKNPYSLVLLDEIEKADAQLLSLFLQVFDAGRLTDGKGRTVHFANTTVVMTSNVGTRLYGRGPMGYGDEGSRVSRSALMKEVKKFFPPEFLNRIDEIVFFDPLSTSVVEEIADLQLRELRERLALENKRVTVEEPVLALLAREGYDPEYGARNLGRTIRRWVLEPLADLTIGMDAAAWSRVEHIRARLEAGAVRFDLEGSEEPLGDPGEPVSGEAGLADSATGEEGA